MPKLPTTSNASPMVKMVLRDSLGILVRPAVINATSYSTSRGNIEDLATSGFGSCVVTGNPETFLDDPLVAPGAGFFYLIQAEGCGTGTLGTDGAGSERLNQNPAACP